MKFGKAETCVLVHSRQCSTLRARLVALRRRESVSGNEGAGRVWKEEREV